MKQKEGENMLDRFERFSSRIFKLSKIWHQIAGEEMAHFGLNASHVSYIVALYKYPEGLTSAMLSKISDKDKSDVSRSLNAMMKSNLVEKHSVHQKGYAGIFLLTDEGKKVAYEIIKKVNFAVKMANENLSEEKRVVFYEILEIFIDNMTKIVERGLSIEEKEREGK